MGIIRKIIKDDENKISGGLIHKRGPQIHGQEVKYEVVDDISGDVVKICESKIEAKNYAKFHNYGTHEINDSGLHNLKIESRI